MGKYGTNFQESEALLALTVDDEDTAAEVLADMLPGELNALAEASDRLAEMARDRLMPGRRPSWASQ